MTHHTHMGKNTGFMSFSALASIPTPVRTGFLYLGLFVYFYSFSKYGLNIWDEGGFANGTLRTLRGERALVDFNPNGYLPGRYWYGALFFKLFGVHIQSLRLAVTLLTPAMVLMVYASARKIMPEGFALLAALFMLSAPSMYYNRFFTFFCVMNLYFLMKALDRPGPRALIFLCGSILVSALFKIEVALFSLMNSTVLLFLIFSRRDSRHNFWSPGTSEGSAQPLFHRPGFWGLLVPLVIGLGLVLTFFLKNHFFEKLFHMVLEAHRVWGNPFPDLLPFTRLLEELGPHKMFMRILFYAPLWVYGIVAVLLLDRMVRSRADFSRRDLQLIAVLSFGICAFGLVVWRAGFDNLLRTLPPFYILFCYLLFLVRGKLLPLVSGGGLFRSPTLRKTALNVLTVALPFLFFYELNIHHGFYAGSIGAMKQETALLRLDRANVYTNPNEARWIQEVVERIETHTRKGDPILALPLNPLFYFLTDRINPTPYDWILPGMLGSEEEERLVERLKNRTPRMIIYVDIPIDSREERRLSHYAPRLYRFIYDHYGLSETIGFFQILLPKK